MILSSIPYVVSGDVFLLLSKWAKQKKFILPDATFFNVWRDEFKNFFNKIFVDFIFISEEDLSEKINSLLKKISLPKVSLEEVYSKVDLFLSTNRTVDARGNDLTVVSRWGHKSIDTQVDSLKNLGLDEVVLIDDVIFSGESTSKIIQALLNVGIKVPLVVTGIGIADGIEKIESCGSHVVCGFKFEEVIDEVCERDFFPGVPLSGRTLVWRNGKNIGIPYILPFGKIGKWASIPMEWQKSFSEFCLQQTIQLFRAIEKSSNKQVCCCDLDRFVFSMPYDESNFVSQLECINI